MSSMKSDTLFSLDFHRMEQWDYNCIPILCVHFERPGSSTRIFCLWKWGIQIGKFRVFKPRPFLDNSGRYA